MVQIFLRLTFCGFVTRKPATLNACELFSWHSVKFELSKGIHIESLVNTRSFAGWLGTWFVQ
jgi:hypothetical protein